MSKAVEKNIEKQAKPKEISDKDTLPPKGPEFGQHLLTEIP